MIKQNIYPNSGAIVETILARAKNMNLRVVAEGLETKEQAEFLDARAKVIHQGYLFAKPADEETIFVQSE